jgi:hypothetical protein
MEAKQVRPPAVAGMFYPADTRILAADIAGLLDAAPVAQVRPKALIVPHAGYVYSGPVAASAYALLAPLRTTIRRVVLFGPTHRVSVRGLATSGVEFYATPLGNIRLDRDAIATALRLPQVKVSDLAHAMEHSLEVQLPFLQTMLESFTLAPFAVGDASAGEVAQVMEALWGGDETLIVVSSDLSHYRAYGDAQAIDRQTADDILHLRLLADFDQACGATPVNGLIEAARHRNLQAQLLDLRNSGDTAGDKSRVVGYAAFAFGAAAGSVPAAVPDSGFGAALLVRARNAIAAEFGAPQIAELPDVALDAPAATFVTLTRMGELRGCIGSLEAWRPLAADVRANAHAAAFRDPRFPPLRPDELASTHIEVSLLSPPQEMAFIDEADARRQLRPGIDGVILEYAGRRGTFLPQVWESLAEPKQFLDHLKQKAGLPADFWAADIRLYRYEVRKWKETAKN